MNKHLLFLPVLHLAAQISFAQCPPPNTPIPGNIGAAAPLFCDLNGYCNSLSFPISPQEPFPGCPTNVIDNPHWFAFKPLSSSINFQITPSNCQGNGSVQGMHGAIYQDNGPVPKPLSVQCPCTVSPFNLAYDNLNPCETYYLMLDGCGGDICDYFINVVGGALTCAPSTGGNFSITSPTACQADSLSGCQRICENTTTLYSVGNIPPGTNVDWEVTGAQSFTENGSSVSVTWGAPGLGEVSAEVSGGSGVGTVPLFIYCDQIGTGGGNGDNCHVYANGGPPGPYQNLGIGGPYELLASSDGGVTFSSSGTFYGGHGFYLPPGQWIVRVVDTGGNFEETTLDVLPTVDNCWLSMAVSDIDIPTDCNTCNGRIQLIWSQEGGTNVSPLTFHWSME